MILTDFRENICFRQDFRENICVCRNFHEIFFGKFLQDKTKYVQQFEKFVVFAKNLAKKDRVE
jgi:hypothetical protein